MTCREIPAGVRQSARSLEELYTGLGVMVQPNPDGGAAAPLAPPRTFVPDGQTTSAFPYLTSGDGRAFNLAPLFANDRQALQCLLTSANYDEARARQIDTEASAITDDAAYQTFLSSLSVQDARTYSIFRTLRIIEYFRGAGNRDRNADVISADEIENWAWEYTRRDQAAYAQFGGDAIARMHSLLGIAQFLQTEPPAAPEVAVVVEPVVPVVQDQPVVRTAPAPEGHSASAPWYERYSNWIAGSALVTAAVAIWAIRARSNTRAELRDTRTRVTDYVTGVREFFGRFQEGARAIEGRLPEIRAERVEIEGRLPQLRADLETRSDAIGDLKTRIGDVETSAEAIRGEIRAQQETISRIESEGRADRSGSGLQGRRAERARQMTEARDAIRDAEGRLRAAEQEIEALGRTRETNVTERDGIRRQVATAEARLSEIDALEVFGDMAPTSESLGSVNPLMRARTAAPRPQPQGGGSGPNP